MIGTEHVPCMGSLDVSNSFLDYASVKAHAGSKISRKKRKSGSLTANSGYFSYKAVRVVLNQLYEMNNPARTISAHVNVILFLWYALRYLSWSKKAYSFSILWTYNMDLTLILNGSSNGVAKIIIIIFKITCELPFKPIVASLSKEELWLMIWDSAAIYNLASVLACLGLLVFKLFIYFLSRPRYIYFLDFACYKPSHDLKLPELL
ncbi:3-ketoacyl-CoA synthase [Striga asiatica]|uniref:3-ketoacyl-CoA synthase n=1 Tax=Striga asiatica TaxID=4170 RepID=A0A5A7PC71_STRAF|nr:3-ketoacyl-CoA synthase [Striga asiatica]